VFAIGTGTVTAETTVDAVVSTTTANQQTSPTDSNDSSAGTEDVTTVTDSLTQTG